MSIILRERYERADGTPAAGSVAVKPRWTFSQGDRTITNEWVMWPLDVNGEVEVEIPAHDNTDPAPIWFLVIENVPECGLRQMAFNLPAQIPDGEVLRLGDYRSMSIYANPPTYGAQGDNMYFGYGVNPGHDEYGPGGARDGMTPAVGEARFFAGEISVWTGTDWEVQVVRKGDEYTDMLTGVVHALNP